MQLAARWTLGLLPIPELQLQAGSRRGTGWASLPRSQTECAQSRPGAPNAKEGTLAREGVGNTGLTLGPKNQDPPPVASPAYRTAGTPIAAVFVPRILIPVCRCAEEKSCCGVRQLATFGSFGPSPIRTGLVVLLQPGGGGPERGGPGFEERERTAELSTRQRRHALPLTFMWVRVMPIIHPSSCLLRSSAAQYLIAILGVPAGSNFMNAAYRPKACSSCGQWHTALGRCPAMLTGMQTGARHPHVCGTCSGSPGEHDTHTHRPRRYLG